MAIHVLSTSRRTRAIQSISNHNQCGGPKKAGISKMGWSHPRDNYKGVRTTKHPLNYYFKKCSDIPKSKMTMNPVGAGGVGSTIRLTKITFHGNGL
tara:strand:- start:106 stop:393 length:288 start_codon:yes stop_codon:yes gene_type:complete